MIYLLFIIVIFIVTFLVLSYFNKSLLNKHWTDNEFIAHAAGGIDDTAYTNSVEAFEENYEKGFRLFEIDLLLTTDNKVVARHDWKEDYGQGVDNLPLSYDEFMSKKYYDKYTSMDFKTIVELMKRFPDTYVIIDGKTKSVEDTKLLYELIGEEVEGINRSVFKRFIPQMFYKDDLEIIRDHGFQEVLYVVGREDYTYDSIAQYSVENGIKAVSLSVDRTDEEFVQTLLDDDVLVYMYTFNDEDEMTEYRDIGVHGFFTDFVTPQSSTRKTD